MAKFKGIVKLSHSQYKSLKNNGSLTVGDQTIIYDPVSTLYVTRGLDDSGTSSLIDSISVDGVRILPDENKNVDIDLSGKADKTDIQTTLNEAKAYTNTKVADLVNSAPETLDTLGEVAKAIQENESVVDALNSAIGSKADKNELADYVKNTDYATSEKAGVVKLGAGLSFSNNTQSAYILKANEQQIEQKIQHYAPIVPSNMDYAWKVAATTNTAEWTDEEKASARDLLGVSQEDFDKLVNNKTQINGVNNNVLLGKSMLIGTYYNVIGIGLNSQPLGNNSIAIGQMSYSRTNAISIGASSNAIGSNSIAIGHSTYLTTDNGVAIGNEAKGSAANVIQLGTGSNETPNSLQIFGDNIYNHSTHTLTVQNIELNGVDLGTQLGDINTALEAILGV